MALLTREQILAADDVKTVTVEVPEWGGSVAIRGLSGAGRDAFETELFSIRRTGSGRNGVTDVNLSGVAIRANLLSRCIVDETGQQLFTHKDVELLGAKSAVALDRCYEVAQRLSGITKEDAAEIEGNSRRDQN